MTSAPGLGAAIDALDCDEPAISYGATQPLATFMYGNFFYNYS